MTTAAIPTAVNVKTPATGTLTPAFPISPRVPPDRPAAITISSEVIAVPTPMARR